MGSPAQIRRRTSTRANVFHDMSLAGVKSCEALFCWFGMIFGIILIYVRIHAYLVRVRPPLPAVEYPVERCIWRFAGLFYLECFTATSSCVMWASCLAFFKFSLNLSFITIPLSYFKYIPKMQKRKPNKQKFKLIEQICLTSSWNMNTMVTCS